jgi:hypothetical protein
MKLVVIAVDQERQGDVIAVLEQAGVRGYSIIPSVLGRGETGAHFGTRAFPGANAMVIALVSPAELERARAGLQAVEASLRPGQGLMAFGLPADPLW